MEQVIPLPGEHTDQRIQELGARLKRLERRDWWLWWAAVVVMLLLTVAVISLSFPALLQERNTFFEFHLNQAVRGLVGLVLLFNTYTIYQQIMIKRLRRLLSEQIDITAHLEVRAEEFYRLALHDPLTGLYNRRFAERRLEEEIARTRRHNHPFTILMLDLDHFKQINDRYGHTAGDQVLKLFAERLNRAIRGSDLAVRMGGDEFIALLPECTPEQVGHVLVRLRNLTTEFAGHTIPITFSSGWANYETGESATELLRRADEALYADKRTHKEAPHPLASAS